MAVLIRCRRRLAPRAPSRSSRSCAAGPSSATSSERQEPDEVEVEPVLERELERDQHRRAERGDRDRVAAARDEGDDHGEARAPAASATLRGRGGRRGPRPRTASRGRPGSRACGRRTCPSAVAERDRRERERAERGEARRGEHARRRGRRRSVANSGASTSGANFVSAGRGDQPRRAAPAGRAPASRRSRAAPTSASLAFEFATSSVNGNAAHSVGEQRAELRPAQPPAEQPQPAAVSRSKATAAACAAGRSSQPPLHGSSASNGT